jgi:hypothetical protein
MYKGGATQRTNIATGGRASPHLGGQVALTFASAWLLFAVPVLAVFALLPFGPPHLLDPVYLPYFTYSIQKDSNFGMAYVPPTLENDTN